MFGRFHVGVSWNPDAFAVVVQAGRQVLEFFQEALPKASIDASSGHIVGRESLQSIMQSISVFKSQRLRIASVSLSIPSALAYVHTWVESGRTRPYSRSELSQRVEALFPGKLDQLLFDACQCAQAARRGVRVMLVVVNRNAVEDYLSLLGARRDLLVHTTTAEIARYNACCQLHPEVSGVPVIVVHIGRHYMEVSGWIEGVIWSSQRTKVPGGIETLNEGSLDGVATGRGDSRVRAFTDSLGLVLERVLSLLSAEERAICRVVISPSPVAASAERCIRALGFHALRICGRAVTSELAHKYRTIQSLAGDGSWDTCEGVVDALGTLAVHRSDQKNSRDIVGAISGLVSRLGSARSIRDSRSQVRGYKR